MDASLLCSDWDPQVPLPFESAISPSILLAVFRHVWGFIGGVDEVKFGDAVEEYQEPSSPTLVEDDDAVEEFQVYQEPSSPTLVEDDDAVEEFQEPSSPTLVEDDDGLSFHSDDLVSWAENETIIVPRHATDTDELEAWDEESDDDSLMPRRRHKLDEKGNSKTLFDWEGLEDKSTCCLESTDETASLTSCEESCEDASFADLDSVLTADSVSTGYTSIASMETIVTSATAQTKTTVDTYATTASRPTLEAITKAMIGLKAVKADDAEVPVYLWDLRIVSENAPECEILALSGFRKFGLRLFWRGLFKDCIARLHSKFGRAWLLMATHSPSGKLTRIGKEREAMTNLLWHATQASWFEYHCGLRVYHFRFPIRYQRMARDGVPVYFEKAGPDTMQPQPDFPDSEVREREFEQRWRKSSSVVIWLRSPQV
jgi:hypothetical protein